MQPDDDRSHVPQNTTVCVIWFSKDLYKSYIILKEFCWFISIYRIPPAASYVFGVQKKIDKRSNYLIISQNKSQTYSNTYVAGKLEAVSRSSLGFCDKITFVMFYSHAYNSSRDISLSI